MIVIKLEQLATTINNHIVKDALVISVFPVAVNSKYITAAPDTDVNTPAACFIFSKVIFVPNALLALMLCKLNQDSKVSFGNFSFCKTADMTFGLFNSNILCCSHIYVIY